MAFVAENRSNFRAYIVSCQYFADFDIFQFWGFKVINILISAILVNIGVCKLRRVDN